MKYIVDKLMPTDDGKHVLMRVYYDPENLEVLHGDEYKEVGGKVKKISSWYHSMCMDDRKLEKDMENIRRDMVAKAEGYCCMTCYNHHKQNAN